MPIWLIIGVIALYVSGLFYMAWWVDRRAAAGRWQPRSLIYALALTVYCTSWTFFGAVGTAADRGWEYILIYIGPALVFIFGAGVIRRIGDIAERESISTLSDFLSARYGKSRGVAVLATCAAVMGSLPYIALQLKSVGMSLAALAPDVASSSSGPANETILLTALSMAIFAMVFGTRHSDGTTKNSGLMAVLAFEALIKIAALILVCILSFRLLGGLEAASVTRPADVFSEYTVTGRTITLLLLSMAVIICLPRQFHIAMIERNSAKDVATARWVFPLYMLATSAVVVPITLAGLSVLPSGVSPDLFVLDIPLSQGQNLLALLVFLGGFSAATGMVVVSTIALSNMVTNDLVVPAIMRTGRLSKLGGDSGARLVTLRRFVIVALLFLAYVYYRFASSSEALAQMGVLSFAAAAQFAPSLLGGIFWQGGRWTGVIAGLSLGLILWIYTLFLPAIIGIDVMAAALPGWMNPHAFMGYNFGDSLTHGVFWSLSANILAFVLVSLNSKERLRDRIQASAFVRRVQDVAESSLAEGLSNKVTPDGLKTLAARFLSASAVDNAFQSFHDETGLAVSGAEPADWRLVQRTEKLLASALGTSSARVVLSSAVGGQDVQLGDVLSILDQQTQAERFDRHMLQSMLENIPLGISVVDQDQKLVAWNSFYADLFNYEDSLLQIGTPVATLIQQNIDRGWIKGDPKAEAFKRIRYMKEGKFHRYEREHIDGRFLRMQGSPMPGGGYVTLFMDITEDKLREKELEDSNEQLEARVEERTRDLQDLMEDLHKAREDAEGANASKTRFLAAASHDLLQPLNAARLFLGAIKPSDAKNKDLISKADRAVKSADDLLKGLLDISKLDHGNVTAQAVSFPLGPMMEDLAEEADVMARRAGLEVRVVPTTLSAETDPDFLQSILRNFLSNARRYTHSGAILFGARRAGNQVRIEVWDTGPGIPDDRLPLIFEEFQRFEDQDNLGIRGAGLGLSVVRRLADLMQAKLNVKSVVGRGSVFSITVPRSVRTAAARPATSPATSETITFSGGLKVLCVDDEVSILEAMSAILQGWDCLALTATDAKDAVSKLKRKAPDALIVDYQLKGSQTALDVIGPALEAGVPPGNIVILSAIASKIDPKRLPSDDIQLLSKPVDPADIRAFLARCRKA